MLAKIMYETLHAIWCKINHGMRRCTRCKKERQIGQFTLAVYKSGPQKGRSFRFTECKSCRREAQRASRCLPCFREVFSGTSIVACAIAMLVSSAFSQSQTGTLVGLIHDPQHKVVTGVQVQLSRVDATQPVSHKI